MPCDQVRSDGPSSLVPRAGRARRRSSAWNPPPQGVFVTSTEKTVTNQVTISVAGIATRAVSEQGDLRFCVPEPERRFLVADGVPHITLRCRLAEPPAAPSGECVFETPDVWSLVRHGTRLWLDQYRGRLGFRVARTLDLSADLSEGLMTVAPREADACHQTLPDGTAINPFVYPSFPLLIYWHLAARGGFGLHASGAILDGRAIAFAGVSGAGKSTLSEILAAEGATILNDDRLGVVPDQEGYRLYGTPWHGTAAYASPQSGPLRAVFFIEHGDQNGAERLAHFPAVVNLIARACPPYHSRELMARVAESCSAVAATVPCFRLRFLPDRRVISTILAALDDR
jgi:hypothetical protein